MKQKTHAPQVLDYLDVTSYLKDYYHHRKSTAASFSYEKWVQELDINLSRVFLRLAVLGLKKLPSAFIESFSEKSLSTRKEKDYFVLLVKCSQAKTHEEQQLYMQKMVRILKTDLQLSLIDDYADFISSPLIPRLLTLLSFKDMKHTPANLSYLLNVQEDEVMAALETLQKSKLAEAYEKGNETLWRACHSKNKVADHQGDVNLLTFHEKSLQDAIKAFHLPKSLRKYRSLLLALSEDELKRFYANLDNFVAEQVVQFGSDSYHERRLFQLNLNIHPVAQDQKALPSFHEEKKAAEPV